MTAPKETSSKSDPIEVAKTMTSLAVTNALPKPGFVNVPRVSLLEAIIAWGMAAKSVFNGDKK